MELISILVWPATLCFIAYCVYATYTTAQEKKAAALIVEIARLRQELEYKHDNYLNDCNVKIDSIETYVEQLEAKITVLSNSMQWNKK